MTPDNTIELTVSLPAWGYWAGGVLLWYAFAAAVVRYKVRDIEWVLGHSHAYTAHECGTPGNRAWWWVTSPVAFPAIVAYVALRPFGRALGRALTPPEDRRED